MVIVVGIRWVVFSPLSSNNYSSRIRIRVWIVVVAFKMLSFCGVGGNSSSRESSSNSSFRACISLNDDDRYISLIKILYLYLYIIRIFIVIYKKEGIK